MLSGVASLLFGNAAGEVTVDQTQESQQVDLDTKDAELGWLLVDVQENIRSNHQDQQGCDQELHQPGLRSGHQEEQCWLPVPVSPLSPSPPCLAGACVQVADNCFRNIEQGQPRGANPICGLTEACVDGLVGSDLTESWIVTPPPCFTASGSVAQLEESPLENLLIEHPSMSVYHAHRGSESTNDQENIVAVVPPSGHRRQHGVVQQTQRRPHVLASHSSTEQIRVARSYQRQQCKTLSKQFNRKCTERSNKTRLQNYCRKQGSARNRSLRPSGCMSGRRGQRAQ
ncbi:hypothetical protein BaRGS_00009857 [Batillaria attramentaria]|uniref:Uncharacterized protein n=1 Tax=Batillaria attramentaria TaxID=370345 RepID=A0ABD0LH80_9CAEN